jgi:hypothetical protein
MYIMYYNMGEMEYSFWWTKYSVSKMTSHLLINFADFVLGLSSTLKMEAIFTFKTSGSLRTTSSYYPDAL